MRLLFVNHTARWSGAEVSLMRLVEALRADHEIAVACPADGPLAEAVDRAGVARLPLPAVEVSLRLHPTQTATGLARLLAGGVALARTARRFRPDVIHANTLRAGLMAAPAVRLGAPPVVVRVHDRVPPTRVGRAIRSVVAGTARAVVAVSDFTARSFDEGLDRPVAVRVYNSVDHAALAPATLRPAGLRAELGLAPGAALLGQVAQITPWKGQDTAVRALAELRASGIDAHLALVGEITFAGKAVRYDNHRFRRELDALAVELGVQDAVHFLGRREDVPAILRDLDLSLLPSRDEPFGLVTVESMAVGTPPLVSDSGAGPELVADGATGRLLAPDRPRDWAEAARELLQDPLARARMGERGATAAADYRDERQGSEMLEIYERVAGRPAPATAAGPPGVPARADELAEAVRWPS